MEDLLKEWNGRVSKKKVHGYIFIKVGLLNIPEHRLVAEEVLGRTLTYQETIHHIDGNKKNNSPSNLALFSNQKEHAQFHTKINQFGQTRALRRLIDDRRITNIKLSLKN